jgi:hypothetical protein
MRIDRFGGLVLATLCLAALLPAVPAAAQTDPSEGTARVWFLRPTASSVPSLVGAAPIVFVDGKPIGRAAGGTAFYRDFPPGTYSFSVEPYGLPTGQTDTVQLEPGTETYLQVQWISSWEIGVAEQGWSFAPNTFAVLTMSPQVAQPYLRTLAFTPG